MNLKTLIMRRIIYVAVVCQMAVAAYAMRQANVETRQRQQSVAEALARQAELQLLKIDSGLDVLQQFPDWEVLYQSGSLAGLCARFVNPEGAVVKNLCRGPETQTRNWPEWFAVAYSSIFSPGRELVREVRYRKIGYGRVVVTAPPDIAIAKAWRDLNLLSGLALALLAGIFVVLYITIGKALRPVEGMLSRLDCMAAGDLSVRLQQHGLMELQRIAAAVNKLAAALQNSIAEHTALTLKLMQVQEQEREQLARDLHDEFGQHLAGINAMAASIAYSARETCPDLARESGNIIGAVGRLLDLLRGMLIRLRPPEIALRGLGESLRGLVLSWNTYSGGKMRFELELDAQLGRIPDETALHLYRLVQECLTNAVKHSDATLVHIRLALPASDRDGPGLAPHCVEVVVEDNGTMLPDDRQLQSGRGLPGMRERIAALGGQLRIYRAAAGGLGLCAAIPLECG